MKELGRMLSGPVFLMGICSSILHEAWARGGECVAIPTSLPPYPHLSRIKHGPKVGNAWLSPPLSRLSPTYPIPCMDHRWAMRGFSHSSPIYPLPSMGYRWAMCGFSHFSPAFLLPIPYHPWATDGKCLLPNQVRTTA